MKASRLFVNNAIYDVKNFFNFLALYFNAKN